MWDNFRRTNTYAILALEGKKGGEDIIFEDIVGWQFSIFGENYKPTDPRSSVNPRHKIHKPCQGKSVTLLKTRDKEKLLKRARE